MMNRPATQARQGALEFLAIIQNYNYKVQEAVPIGTASLFESLFFFLGQPPPGVTCCYVGSPVCWVGMWETAAAVFHISTHDRLHCRLAWLSPLCAIASLATLAHVVDPRD